MTLLLWPIEGRLKFIRNIHTVLLGWEKNFLEVFLIAFQIVVSIVTAVFIARAFPIFSSTPKTELVFAAASHVVASRPLLNPKLATWALFKVGTMSEIDELFLFNI